MKMENEITAPIAGRISAIQVQKGGAVNAQDPLFTIEP
jgi:biotin carboxyl carrier protein